MSPFENGNSFDSFDAAELSSDAIDPCGGCVSRILRISSRPENKKKHREPEEHCGVISVFSILEKYIHLVV